MKRAMPRSRKNDPTKNWDLNQVVNKHNRQVNPYAEQADADFSELPNDSRKNKQGDRRKKQTKVLFDRRVSGDRRRPKISFKV